MRVFALALCLLIAACGFQPLYRNTNTLTGGSTSLQRVWIQTIPNESGVRLRNALVDRFYHNGSPQNPDYTLEVNLIEHQRGIVIERDDTTTRSQIVVSAQYTLRRKSDRTVIDTGTLRASSAYNILSSQYTTLVTMDQARVNALRDLADKMTLRLATILER
jgi:LPS-assembly lipoprotein